MAARVCCSRADNGTSHRQQVEWGPPTDYIQTLTPSIGESDLIERGRKNNTFVYVMKSRISK